MHIVKDSKSGKSRGYGFVEFSDDREADRKSHQSHLTIIIFIGAVRQMDGRKIDQHRIIVDRELGRTRTSWLPRRLGGGKGDARRDRKDEQLIKDIKKLLVEEEPPV